MKQTAVRNSAFITYDKRYLSAFIPLIALDIPFLGFSKKMFVVFGCKKSQRIFFNTIFCIKLFFNIPCEKTILEIYNTPHKTTAYCSETSVKNNTKSSLLYILAKSRIMHKT